jgi:hypothetical protein
VTHETELLAISREAREAPESGIVEVFNYGRTRKGLIPLWAGEGDLPTPSFISDAAAKSLRDGETFYTYQRGSPNAPHLLTSRQFGRFSRRSAFVTGSGMQRSDRGPHGGGAERSCRPRPGPTSPPRGIAGPAGPGADRFGTPAGS